MATIDKRSECAVALALAISILPVVAFGYEVETHAEMSGQAISRSTLADPSGALNDLGLQSLNQQRFFGTSIVDLVRSGSVDEDSSLGFRFRNHFYNPLNGAGFTHPVLPNGLPSPTWGLEDTTFIVAQTRSFSDARARFHAALTAASTVERDVGFAETFRNLGHVIHLIQDAAQPQHARNDSHATGRMYERLTNESVASLPYQGYPVVRLNSARAYWHSQPADADPFNNAPAKRGMAEYSNRGFVSAGTNFEVVGNQVQQPAGFPSPMFDPATELPVDIRTLDSSTTLTGTVFFYGNNVVDSYDSTQTRFNPFATTRSIFDEELKRYLAVAPGDDRGLFTLNRFNYLHAQTFLIPRAVGYSAGMLDYFFRGKIDLSADPNDATRFVIVNRGTEGMNGTFTLYYDAAGGLRLPVPGGQWSTSGVLPAGGQMSVPGFSPPTVPAPQRAGEYMLVFTGTMGTESPNPSFFGAVAGKLVQLTSHPNVLLASAFDANRGCEFYQSADQGMTWSLVSTIADSACSEYSMVYVGNRTVLLLVADALTGFQYMHRSVDAGRTWARVTQDFFPFGAQIFGDGWLYLGNNRIFTSDRGGDITTNFARISDDHGATWTRLGRTNPFRGGFWLNHAFLGNNTILAAPKFTFGPFLTRSVDGGVTWSLLRSFPNASSPWASDWINTVAYLGNNRVLLSGFNTFNAPNGGFVYRSDDGGSSWSRLASAPGASGIALQFLVYLGNDTVWFYDGSSATAFRSMDAGASWAAFGDPLPKPFLNVIYLGDSGAVPGLY